MSLRASTGSRGSDGAEGEDSSPGRVFDADEEIQKAKSAAFRLLSGRAYTRAEIDKKLKGRQFSRQAITRTMATLEELGLVDDRAFARQWVQARLQGRPMGRFRMTRELKRRGVPEALVEEALDEALAEVEPIELALELLRGRAARYRGLERQKALARMYQFVGRRGFATQVAREAARLIWAELGEGQEEANWA